MSEGSTRQQIRRPHWMKKETFQALIQVMSGHFASAINEMLGHSPDGTSIPTMSSYGCAHAGVCVFIGERVVGEVRALLDQLDEVGSDDFAKSMEDLVCDDKHGANENREENEEEEKEEENDDL